MTKTLSLYILSVIALTLFAVAIYQPVEKATGSGYIGWPIHMQAADGTADVGPDTTTTLFADAADCKARIITTNNGAIWLSFDDDYLASTTLAAGVGHYQAASTTVAYESGIYGCGRTTAFSVASGTVTTSSF